MPLRMPCASRRCRSPTSRLRRSRCDRCDRRSRCRARDVLGSAPRGARLVPRAHRRRRARDENRRSRQPLGRPALARPGGTHPPARLAPRFGQTTAAGSTVLSASSVRSRCFGPYRRQASSFRSASRRSTSPTRRAAHRHARQPGARGAADRARTCLRHAAAARSSSPSSPGWGSPTKASSARAATRRRSPATSSCTSSRARCSSRKASTSGSSPASSERLAQGRVRRRSPPRRDDADGGPARCGCRRGSLRGRRQGAGRP